MNGYDTKNIPALILISCLLLVSCKKKPVVEIDPLFSGSWRCIKSSADKEYLSIESDGRGFIETFENNEHKNTTQPRKWLTKNDHLYFGWLGMGSEKFSIDSYPKMATDTILLELDTIFPNQKYMILDGRYYHTNH